MMKRSRQRLLARLARAVAVASLLMAAAVAADRIVDANEPVIVSNDITNQLTTVVSAGAGG